MVIEYYGFQLSTGNVKRGWGDGRDEEMKDGKKNPPSREGGFLIDLK